MPNNPQTTPDPDLEAFEQEEKERIERLDQYTSKELLKEILRRLKWFSDMEYRFGCILDHATGGRMSKTNYDKDVMYGEMDAYIQRERDEAFEEGVKSVELPDED